MPRKKLSENIHTWLRNQDISSGVTDTGYPLVIEKKMIIKIIRNDNYLKNKYMVNGETIFI